MESVGVLSGRRTATRRSLRMPCRLLTDEWDGAAELLTRDISTQGLFVDASLALDEGAEVVVSFTPPGGMFPLYLYGRVRRVGLPRRATDDYPAGMGIEFASPSPWHLDLLGRSLWDLPILPSFSEGMGASEGRETKTMDAADTKVWLDPADEGRGAWVEGPAGIELDESDWEGELEITAVGDLLTGGRKPNFH